MSNEFFYDCVNVVSATPDITIILLKPHTTPLHFNPGQYVEVLLETGAILPLSMSNLPCEEGKLEFHIRHDNGHPVAQHFCDEIAQHKTIRLRGPFGHFNIARAKPGNNLLFLAGGTGIAPIKALLASLFQTGQKTPLSLYWGVRKPIDAYDEQLLKIWQQQFPWFKYTIVLSEPEHFPDWQGPRGLAHALLATRHPQLEQDCIFASGPYSMIRAAHSLFTSLGLTKDQFICDMLQD